MSFQVEGLRFAYPGRPATLDIASFAAEQGERIFLYGPSGSGKTTLLGLLGGVLHAEHGRVAVLQQDIQQLRAGERDRFRGARIGFLFQLFNLIPYLSALENIVLPCQLSAARRARLKGVRPVDAAAELAEHLEISAILERSVAELSVGQQQRVAAARALIGSPELVIADEPTSALDSDRREAFVQLLFKECRAAGATVLFVSHDRSLAPLFDRSIALPEINRAHLAAQA